MSTKPALRRTTSILFRFIISTITLYFFQQAAHELGHVITCIILGGRVKGCFFSISGAYVTLVVPNKPIVVTMVNLSGGFLASLLLLIVYELTQDLWVEFNTIVLMFLFVNLLTAFFEGFMNDIYVQNLELWSYTAIPFLALSVFLLRNKYNRTYR